MQGNKIQFYILRGQKHEQKYSERVHRKTQPSLVWDCTATNQKRPSVERQDKVRRYETVSLSIRLLFLS